PEPGAHQELRQMRSPRLRRCLGLSSCDRLGALLLRLVRWTSHRMRGARGAAPINRRQLHRPGALRETMRLGGWLLIAGLPEPEYQAMQTLCRRHGATQSELIGISIRILARLENGSGDAVMEWPDEDFGVSVSNLDAVMASPSTIDEYLSDWRTEPSD